VTLDAVIKVGPLLAGTYAQKTELIALTWVPQLAAGVWVNIYMDSKFAFTTIHVH
jgi:hypothetical protein